jgi:hypothetical protein
MKPKPMRLIAAFAVGLLLSLTAFAQEMKILPVDEAATDRSWVTFKNRLLTALQKHDRKFVLSIVDRNIRNGVDGGRGSVEFRKQWNIESDESPLWRELASALFLGGAYLKREKGPAELCTPYLLAKWPPDIDPFGHGVIVTSDAAVKKEPNSSSTTLQTLSYDIVPVTDWEIADREAGVAQRWVKVRVKDADGYVPEEHIRSPIEHAACFVKGVNGWRMVAFAPAGGD